MRRRQQETGRDRNGAAEVLAGAEASSLGPRSEVGQRFRHRRPWARRATWRAQDPDQRPVGGHVMLAFNTLPPAIGNIQAGKLNAIGVPRRLLAALPEAAGRSLSPDAAEAANRARITALLAPGWHAAPLLSGSTRARAIATSSRRDSRSDHPPMAAADGPRAERRPPNADEEGIKSRRSGKKLSLVVTRLSRNQMELWDCLGRVQRAAEEFIASTEGGLNGQEPRHHHHDAGRDHRVARTGSRARGRSREVPSIPRPALRIGGQGRDRRGADRRPRRPAAGRSRPRSGKTVKRRAKAKKAVKRKTVAKRRPAKKSARVRRKKK